MNNKRAGNKAEQAVLEKLQAQGAVAEIIETKMRLGRVGGRAILIPDSGKKLGDIFGVMSGKALLVEVKDHDEERLQYSVLKDHQHENMRKWAAAGGLSMIGWVRGSRICLFVYPMGWLPGSSCHWETANA